ncbi:major facilitator superfamily protein [Lentilactobacillus otakiensis DSM 19908 = JCM 15040]|uniref:MFS family major facilitator transporter n=1 Tax=Lentilactobacillus otakiensis DSM 19908 = JCM 15040 TaxID=1423780 RepID=S4NBX9_9LACO|nr:MFS transporter [Lentilactobacillus otakiensis]KRL10333.1 major facilitator superfamily protein [Lentilactobacillus otakiensis DSM 19908 = JCM 15040]GAD16244.1 MFS family major facilitator transporter [Lentilactobacillus otakiensis DSM 19908 = JCM 15040]
MTKSATPQWKKNMWALWFGNFATGAGASMSMPFLPLFISTMGNFPKWELTLYAGLAFSGVFLSQAIVSPLWGNLADKTGRKPMLLRAAIGMTISATLTGLSPNVWFLIIIRFIQGTFSGYINNAYALIASEVPTKDSGKTMGTLTTGNVGGQLIGPIIGGYLSGIFGYRLPFYMFGFMMFLASLSTWFFVKEDFTPIKKGAKTGMRDAFKGIVHKRVVWAMIISSMLVMAATTSINPIISLFVKELMHNHGNIAFTSGVIAALPGIATIFVAPSLGRLGDHIGPQKILLVGLLFSAVIYFPMFFTAGVVMLGILRFLIGIANAALLPITQTVMTLEAPARSVSRIFSYNQSFQAMGAVVGPMLASGVAGILDYRYVFLMTTLLVVVNIIVVVVAYKKDNVNVVDISNS